MHFEQIQMQQKWKTLISALCESEGCFYLLVLLNVVQMCFLSNAQVEKSLPLGLQAVSVCLPTNDRTPTGYNYFSQSIIFFITAIYFFLNKGDHCLACGMQHGWETCLYSSTGRVSHFHQSVSFILQLVDVTLVCQQGVLFEFLKTERNKCDVQWQWIYMAAIVPKITVHSASHTSFMQRAPRIFWLFQFTSNNFICWLRTSNVWEHQSSAQ